MKNDKKETFLWHDYETFGLDPKLSNVAQFAAIRTDMDLNIIGDKIDIICSPTLDRLPSPEACMITGISPLKNRMKGMNEISFFQIINKEMSQYGTCSIGYNNIQFDDEVTRNGLYRNFIDPYKREWSDNCSRWDLLNVLRIVDALKPNTFVVPIDPETGNKVFKLDQLSVANGISHENAHDALADVIATIEMAKIIKNKEPELFNKLFLQRKKSQIEKLLIKTKGFNAQSENTLNFKPFIMAESFFGAKQNFIEILYPIYSKGVDVFCIKLTKEIGELFKMSKEEIKESLYKKTKEMSDGEQRLPLHAVKVNKCPVILTIDNMNKEQSLALSISGDQLRSNIQKIKENFELLKEKLTYVFNTSYDKDSTLDVDQQIYNGFFSKADGEFFEKIKKTDSIYLMDLLKEPSAKFLNERIPEMLFRYTCRNFESDLDPEHIEKWDNFCRKRITSGIYSMTFEEYFEKLENFKEIYKNDEKKLVLLKDLFIFGEKTKSRLFKK